MKIEIDVSEETLKEIRANASLCVSPRSQNELMSEFRKIFRKMDAEQLSQSTCIER